MKRTEEQLEALEPWTPKMAEDFRRLCDMDSLSAGLEGVTVFCCFNNGKDTAKDIGVTAQNGFSDGEIQQAADYHTLGTAYLYELI